MTMRFACFVVITVVLCLHSLVYSRVAEDGGPDRSLVKQMRGARYCEILVSNSAQGFWRLLDLTAYNTLMFGCDTDQWNSLTENAVKAQFNSAMVKLNGPRYWTMDTVTESSKLIDSKLTYIGGLKMVVVGIVHVSYYDVLNKVLFGGVTNYVERHVARHTVYVFRANTLVYIMTSPAGKTYIMQSYSGQYSPLTLESLENLSSMLNPPAGWSYKAVKISQDLHVPAVNSIGTLINDEFFNSYSLFDNTLLEGKVVHEGEVHTKCINLQYTDIASYVLNNLYNGMARSLKLYLLIS